MDVQTALVCAGVAVLSAAVIFFISVFSIKEKTYEEAIAEQRQMPEESLLLGRSNKDKNKDKKQKKAGKKVKEKPAEREKLEHHDRLPAPATREKVHVDFEEPEAEIVNERPSQVQDDNSRKQKKKKNKTKPILTNRQEPTPVVDKVPPSTTNHFEATHPKDDLLLKRTGTKEEKFIATSAEEVEKSSVSKGAGVRKEKIGPQKADKTPAVATSKAEKMQVTAAPKADKTVVVAPLKSEKVPLEKAAAPKAEKATTVAPSRVEKPSLAPQPKVDRGLQPASTTKTVSGAEASPVVATAHPVINVKEKNNKKKKELAALQQISGDRDGVNVSLLVPLVGKAELSRSEIQILIDLLLNKQQNSRDDSEWIEGRQDPVVKLRKALADKERALAEEQETMQGVQTKLKELRTQLNAERAQVVLNSRRFEETLAAKQTEMQVVSARLQQLTELHAAEKQSLTTQLQQVQAQLSDERVARVALQEETLSQQNYITQLSDSQTEATERALELARQLEEADRRGSRSEAELQYMRDESSLLATKLAQLQMDAQQLREENEALAAQVERPAADGRENGDLQYEEAAHYETIVQEKDSLLEQLQTELKQKLSLVEKLTSEINTNKTEINKLHSELEAQRSKNDDLRTKNWKAMDALSTTEKFLETKVKQYEKLVSESCQKAHLEEQTTTKHLLQRIFPNVRVEDTKIYEVWVERFESAARKGLSDLTTQVQEHQQQQQKLQQQLQQQQLEYLQLQKLQLEQQQQQQQHELQQQQKLQQQQLQLQQQQQQQEQDDVSDVTMELVGELEKQNSQLQARVAHYKTIIDETEGILNTLQNHVEQEEARWRQQLQLKDAELGAVQEERDHLLGEVQGKLQQLEQTLQQVEEEKVRLAQQREQAFAERGSAWEECERLQERLNVQKAECEELCSEVARLKGLVESGQEKLNSATENHIAESNGPTDPSITEGGSIKK